MASNLPFGSGVCSLLSSAGPPDPRQRPFRPGQPPLSGRLCGSHWRRSQPMVPVSRCLSAAGVRFSGLPAPAGELCLPHVRPTGRDVPAGPHRGCHVPLGRDAAGVGAAWTPGTVVRSRPVVGHRPAPAAFQRRSLFSRLLHSACGSPRNEASSAIHLRSPVRPFPGLCPPDGTGGLGPLPGLRTPRSPATHARAGTVLANWTGNYVHRHQPVLLLRVPLAPSDFVSHPPLVVEPDHARRPGTGGGPSAW